MRRKFNGSIEAIDTGIFHIELHHRKEYLANPDLSAMISPEPQGGGSIGKNRWPIQDNKRPSVYTNISRVTKQWLERHNKITVIFRRVVLPNQDFLVQTIPAPSPIFIRPADTEWEIDIVAGEELLYRPLQQSPSSKPIIMKAEPVNPIQFRQLHLPTHNVDQAQVIKTQLPRKLGLLVPDKLGNSLGYIRPLCKSFAPPTIVLGNRMKLRQIKGNSLRSQIFRRCRVRENWHVITGANPGCLVE